MVNFSLEGKIALVTGASYGIGFGIASAYAEAGATICFNDINQEKVDMGLASYKEAGIEAHGYVCDVTDEEQVKAMVAKIKEHQIPVAVSNTAGTFVCNHVTYGVRHLIETKYQGKRSGFIHIPFLPQQVVDKKNMPSMSLDTIVQALVLAIEAIVETKEDIKVTGGATH